MDAAKRIVLNTSAQYIRTIIGGIITLYSARIILHQLGTDDFGIYSLVAGVVLMLSFITNALTSTTQRYVSFYQGKGDKEQLKRIFSNSMFLHLGIGIAVVLLLSFLYIFLFDIIDVPENRINAASLVYFSVIVTLFLSFMASPLRAILISHENIVYTSIVDVLDAVLKLLIALSLASVSFDKLVYYAIMLSLVQLFNFAAFGVYCFKKYEECIWPKISHIDKGYIKDLSGFAGWNIYSMCCQVGRTQGLNIVINRMMGTAVNAAYGLAMQVSSYANFMSGALMNSIRPQIVKAEGRGEREKMLMLSELSCKYGFFLMSLVAIPCIFEMPRLLELWLGDVPDYTVMFANMYLLAIVLDKLTEGLNITNQAIGKLKIFTLWVNSGKLITVPLCYVLLKVGIAPISMAICFVAIEFISALIRLPIIKKQAGLSYKSFFINVISKLFLPTLLCVITCFTITTALQVKYRILLTLIASTVVYGMSFFLLAMQKEERVRIIRTLIPNYGKNKDIVQ